MTIKPMTPERLRSLRQFYTDVYTDPAVIELLDEIARLDVVLGQTQQHLRDERRRADSCAREHRRMKQQLDYDDGPSMIGSQWSVF